MQTGIVTSYRESVLSGGVCSGRLQKKRKHSSQLTGQFN